MQGITKINSLAEIPLAHYTGYIWMSNQDKPETIHNDNFDFTIIGMNPFIVEALLFDEENQISIHITHDGANDIMTYDLKQLKNDGFEFEYKKYLPHRLGDKVDKVHFAQLWKDEPDALCEGMIVNTLKATVFCGFKKIKL